MVVIRESSEERERVSLGARLCSGRGVESRASVRGKGDYVVEVIGERSGEWESFPTGEIV